MIDLERYSFENILQDALAMVPDSMDKREGSIIYDAIAPACYELSLYYMELQMVSNQTFVTTATGNMLELRVEEQGLTRNPETFAYKLGKFVDNNNQPMAMTLGSRFSTIEEDNLLNYVVDDVYRGSGGVVVPGSYRMRCETAGAKGNAYYGALLPITYIRGLKTALLSDILVAAQDAETDEALRLRYIKKVNNRPFGGNIAQYEEETLNIPGIGAVQVYPTWNGGGTVKLSIVGDDYWNVLPLVISNVTKIIDPENVNGDKGDGIGLAPIGHTVTVVTPTVKNITITANISLAPNITLAQVKTPIENMLEQYFQSLREQWGNADALNHYSLGVYISKVISTILEVDGVVNTTSVLLDGVAKDIILTQTASTQQLPKILRVVLNVV